MISGQKFNYESNNEKFSRFHNLFISQHSTTEFSTTTVIIIMVSHTLNFYNCKIDSSMKNCGILLYTWESS